MHAHQTPLRVLTLVMIWAGFAFSSFSNGILWAGGGPENILLVINARDDSSKLIANHYIQLRNIPAANILYLSDVPDGLVVDYTEFRDRILKPILNHLQQSQIGGQIDYVVYSTGFPTSVKIPEHFQALKKRLEQEQEPGTDLTPLLRAMRGQASTTSLTYFALLALADQPAYMLLDANRYFRGPASKILEQPFQGDLQESYLAAVSKIDQQKSDEAIALLTDLHAAHPGQVAVNYQLARAHAQKADANMASEWLIRAVRSGWTYRSVTEADKTFGPINGSPLFSGIVARIPDEPYEVAPTIGFSSRYFWGANGGVNADNQQGVNYILSVMLGTNCPLGNSEQEILHYLSRSVAADYSQPEGTVFFTETKDVRTMTRRPHFERAIQHLERLGGKAEVVAGALPKRGKVAGAMIGAANFNWSQTEAEIVPGAIVENLTSFGGRFEAVGQTKLTELLRYGAAGSSGTVTEPFAIQNKFPDPMIQVHYRRGCNLAEAFYQSVAGPYQLLIVGDALCQPWAKPAQVMVTGIDESQPVKGNVTLDVQFESGDLRAGLMELYLDGRLLSRQPSLERVQFDSRKMTDGYHEMRIVVVSSDLIQSRYRWIRSFEVDNSGESISLSTENPTPQFEDTVRLQASATNADSIALRLNNDEILRRPGKTNEFAVDAVTLGRGPVRLQAIAYRNGERVAVSSPLLLNIQGKIQSEIDPPSTVPNRR